MKAALRVRPGKGEPFDLEISNTATIGRTKENTICLSGSPHVSRQHAIIRCHNAFQYQIMDLGSRNGTFLNGRRVITPTTLNHGSVIRIADTEIHFENIEGATAEGAYEATLASGTDASGQETCSTALMVCDLRGFSTMSEKLEEAVLARTLGEWFRDAGNRVQQSGGIIDKFIGDAVLAYWEKTCGTRCAAAALETGNALLDMAGKKTWPVTGGRFRVAVALHFGVVTSGNIGLVAQRDATIIGDAVNTVFRLESLMKQLGKDLVASGEFLDELPAPPADLEDLGEHQLKGKHQLVRIFGKVAAA
jgi:adenylate cyclase